MLVSIIGVIVVFSIMILSHEFGHFWMAKKMGVKVEVFSFGFGHKIKSFKRGDTEYALSLIPFGGYVKMAGDELSEKLEGKDWEFYSKPIYKRFNIVVAGSLVNYISGALLFCLVFMSSPVLPSKVGGLKEGYPAEIAGIKKDDRIVKIDNWNIQRWEDVLRAIAISKDKVNIKVERSGGIFDFAVEKRTEEETDSSGKTTERKVIGILPSDAVVKCNFLDGIAMGIHETLFLTQFTMAAIWKMLTGTLSLTSVSGPIGIFAITGKAARLGLIPLLNISAFISVSLAIFNLLPFPILDGGHILFLIIEKIKGRPVSRRAQEIAQNIAFALLIAFVLFVSWNDILNLPKWFK